MQADIELPEDVRVSIWYNERKVQKGQAQCLLAENFVKDLDKLGLADKVFQFEQIKVLLQYW